MAEKLKDKNNQFTITAKPGKYMTFALGDENYGVDILKVKEIIGIIDITYVPQLPDYIKGVINLRGKIIPVIDLRLKIGFAPREYDDRTCTIILEILIGNETILLGVIVDRVLEVINVIEENLEATPNFGVSIDTSFILAMTKIDHDIISLLNIQDLLTQEDLNHIQAADKNNGKKE